MTTNLITLYDKYKSYLKPGVWWKSKINTHYKYRKILKIELIHSTTHVYYQDSMMKSNYRLDYFIENHTPITSKWEIFYAKLNHLTSGFFY